MRIQKPYNTFLAFIVQIIVPGHKWTMELKTFIKL